MEDNAKETTTTTKKHQAICESACTKETSHNWGIINMYRDNNKYKSYIRVCMLQQFILYGLKME